MNNLPFKLYKYHKCKTLDDWRRCGLNMDNFDEIYERYIYCKECEWCYKPFKTRRDRCMDHCHLTGEFRGVLCHQCNSCANDSPNITWDKSRNKYRVQIMRNRKWIFRKRCKTREECEVALKQFKDDNWWLFPWHIPNL